MSADRPLGGAPEGRSRGASAAGRVLLALAAPLLFAPLAVWSVRDLRAGVLVERARAQERDLRYDDALASLRAAVALAPDRAEWRLAHAKVARTLWVYRGTPALKAEADAAFAAAARASPHWAAVPFEWARMYAYKLRHEEALARLAPALALDPRQAGLWFERGTYLEALGRRADAAAAYRRCAALEPGSSCPADAARVEARP